MGSFSLKAEVDENSSFGRVTFDNKMFKGIQVKDIENYITEDCTLVIDCDTIPYRAAVLQDNNYIVVKNLTNEEEYTFSTMTEFKGRGKNISQASWLGGVNIKRRAEDKDLYTLDDFEIEKKVKLKFSEDKCLSNIKSFIDEYIDGIKKQTSCETELCLIGGGDCHRHALKLPQIYKGDRASRPTLLKKARDYLKSQYNVEEVEGIEADDVAEMYAMKGYVNYKRNGKFNYILAALDKDARGTPSLLFDYNKEGPIWKNPNPWLIESTNSSVGEIEFIKNEAKCTGLLQICYQLLCGDAIDNYHPYLKFDKGMHPKDSYADASFYEDFVTLKTPEKVLQKTVDIYFKFFPKGLKYTAWDQIDVDQDTFWWLETMFTCVYMLRSKSDDTKFKKYLDHYKVDYSTLVDNNVEKVYDFQEEDELRKVVKDLKDKLETMSEPTHKKSDKKDVLISMLDEKCTECSELLNCIDNMFKIS